MRIKTNDDNKDNFNRHLDPAFFTRTAPHTIEADENNNNADVT
jgi:hypothetical protein